MLLMTRVKNQVNKIEEGFEFNLSNININGAKRGCSGFIRNPKNGIVVYISTEKSCYRPLSDKNLVRFAKDTKDYGGAHSRNDWATDEVIFKKIVVMLNSEDKYKQWIDKI